ncbi:hypothetical protein M378DRAFT_14145 [Amanita muscaria Koide BX008]|uniref:Uncharacterized protein n=1 Tax=Amanita muscaria (strain Koide BX008) TaxID=946122 RepID=A0A0C2WGC9_AMAMK|nr:hypothetical protein M378DRAFT_14145 [Amanita muscaria Koide BX008]
MVGSQAINISRSAPSQRMVVRSHDIPPDRLGLALSRPVLFFRWQSASLEDSLYYVHRSLFEKYANKFPVYGKDASFGDPYTLKDVKQIDFDRLLACLYPE